MGLERTIKFRVNCPTQVFGKFQTNGGRLAARVWKQAAHARQPLPAIPGVNLAGVVESIGTGVTQFHRDDEVYGMTGGVGGPHDSLAEFVAADADLLARRRPRHCGCGR